MTFPPFTPSEAAADALTQNYYYSRRAPVAAGLKLLARQTRLMYFSLGPARERAARSVLHLSVQINGGGVMVATGRARSGRPSKGAHYCQLPHCHRAQPAWPRAGAAGRSVRRRSAPGAPGAVMARR